MAGLALEGINTDVRSFGVNLRSITEYRGQSWGIGGDDGAITVANMVSHYNPSLEGRSHGSHFPFCRGKYIRSMITTFHFYILVLVLLSSLVLKFLFFFLPSFLF